MSYHGCTTLHADINECENGDDNCNENANCTNTEGSFTCSCNPGYSGDGVICTSKLPPYNHFGNCYLMFLYHWFEQILMSATQPMEDVNTAVLIPVAASTAIVTLATCWTGMDSTAVVSVSIALGILHEATINCVYRK